MASRASRAMWGSKEIGGSPAPPAPGERMVRKG